MNTSIPMTPMTIPTTGFVMDFRHSLLECSFLANQTRVQLSLSFIATLPPLNETTVDTFLKNKVIFRMFQIILTLGVHKAKITAPLEKMQEGINT